MRIGNWVPDSHSPIGRAELALALVGVVLTFLILLGLIGSLAAY